jgi:hypothetical protein
LWRWVRLRILPFIFCLCGFANSATGSCSSWGAQMSIKSTFQNSSKHTDSILSKIVIEKCRDWTKYYRNCRYCRDFFINVVLNKHIAFNTASVLLGMDWYKFWSVSRWILYHSSWRKSSSYFRDVGGANLFLTLVSKTDQSGSVKFKSNLMIMLARDVEVHLHVLQTITEQVQLCESGHCSLGELHRCSEIMPGPWGAPDYPTWPRTPGSN